MLSFLVDYFYFALGHGKYQTIAALLMTFSISVTCRDKNGLRMNTYIGQMLRTKQRYVFVNNKLYIGAVLSSIQFGSMGD